MTTEKKQRERVAKLLSRMNIWQKASLLKNRSRAVKRLGLNEYDWWNEALHGVARAGLATVFPQAIGMAASFDEELLRKVADTVSTEARAKYNLAQKKRDFSRYKGLTFWSPNINIYRDPRWGRGQETYGEDPYLTSRLGVAFIRGLQGDDPLHLKTAACAKHFAVHSGPEGERHTFDVSPSKRELFDTYLPAFEAAVREGNVESVMSAYNALYGTPCSCSRYLLEDILRKRWGFRGHVVSDCGAVHDIAFARRYAKSPIKAVAVAVNNGCDLECGVLYSLMGWAVTAGLVSRETLDRAAERLLMTREKLGMLGDGSPYDTLGEDKIASAEHEAFAVEVARKSLVLLKNDGVLPLKPGTTVALVGPNADDKEMLLGNYHGTPSGYVTVRGGLETLLGKARVLYAQGCRKLSDTNKSGLLEEAIRVSEQADVIIVCTGLDASVEGEDGDANYRDERGMTCRGDRPTMALPSPQQKLLDTLLSLGKPLVILNFSGGATTFGGAQERASALMQCWYPGAKGGLAVAEALTGAYNPSGRLPVTFYASDADLPPFEDYNMQNRTYRYFRGKPLYPFGYGLSYTTFAYNNLMLTPAQGGATVSAAVTNTGPYSGEEVVQLYVKILSASAPVPLWSLRKIKRVSLAPGESAEVRFSLTTEDFSYVGEDGERRFDGGEFTVFVGGSSPADRGGMRANVTL